jgi:hypothetical protein
MVNRDEVMAALGQVMDPEIHRPITELDMVKDVSIHDSGLVTVEVLLTVAGCPLKDRITRDVTAAVSPLPGVTALARPRSRRRSPSGATSRPPGCWPWPRARAGSASPR